MKLLTGLGADVAIGVKRMPSDGKGLVVWGAFD
jgi:hypothetical protein